MCLTLWDPVDYTVHGILQARILEWVAFPLSKVSSQPRDWTQVSLIAGGFFFTSWATSEAPFCNKAINEWIINKLEIHKILYWLRYPCLIRNLFIFECNMWRLCCSLIIFNVNSSLYLILFIYHTVITCLLCAKNCAGCCQWLKYDPWSQRTHRYRRENLFHLPPEDCNIIQIDLVLL